MQPQRQGSPENLLIPHEFLMGVVSVGSGATYSRLLPMFTGSEAAQAEAAAFLSALVRLCAQELEWAALE